MAFQKTDKTVPDSNEVIFFTGENYTGDAYSAIAGDVVNLFRNSLGLNDKLYSVKVGSLAKVTLFKDDTLSGSTIIETDKDVQSISVGGPGSGLSSFIVLQREGKYIGRFTFNDKTNEGRSLTLKSSNFNPTGEKENPGVIIPNHNREPGKDPYAPRVFTILEEINTSILPATVGLYVRKPNGSYEDIGALILVYLDDHKMIQAKAFSDYKYGKLTFTNNDGLLAFVWNK